VPGIDECLIEVMRLPGARGASVVDWTSGLALGSIGESPNDDHEATAAETAEVARMAAEQPVFAQVEAPPDGLPAPAVEDVIVTTAPGYHILRFIETAFDSSVFLHLWLDRADGNLALARIRLGEIAERLVLA
jgi:predicted regulator of Ras-like GTPase activity (Roadblock/LC7/MglB family)